MKIFESTLTGACVSIQSDEYGARAYVNSASGRAQLEAECTADVVKAVEAVWGSKPTVTEPVLPNMPAPQPTAEQQQLAAMALQQAQQAATIMALQQTNAALMLKIAGGK